MTPAMTTVETSLVLLPSGIRWKQLRYEHCKERETAGRPRAIMKMMEMLVGEGDDASRSRMRVENGHQLKTSGER